MSILWFLSSSRKFNFGTHRMWSTQANHAMIWFFMHCQHGKIITPKSAGISNSTMCDVQWSPVSDILVKSTGGHFSMLHRWPVQANKKLFRCPYCIISMRRTQQHHLFGIFQSMKCLVLNVNFVIFVQFTKIQFWHSSNVIHPSKSWHDLVFHALSAQEDYNTKICWYFKFNNVWCSVECSFWYSCQVHGRPF